MYEHMNAICSSRDQRLDAEGKGASEGNECSLRRDTGKSSPGELIIKYTQTHIYQNLDLDTYAHQVMCGIENTDSFTRIDAHYFSAHITGQSLFV